MTEAKYVLPALKGSISLVLKDGKVFDVLLHDSPPAKVQGAGRIAEDLKRYFSGEVVDFRTYDVNFTGYTDFQRRVLKAARRIPYGKTMSYKEVAKVAGSPSAARAVGQVMAHNRTCIFIPCHRVVGSNGIGGWSGDIEDKFRLLELEGVTGFRRVCSKRTNSKSGKHRR